MEKEAYLNIVNCLENLEISLDTNEWLYIKDDLSELRESVRLFNKINKNKFYKFKFNELVPEIVYFETEAIIFLKSNNIIV